MPPIFLFKEFEMERMVVSFKLLSLAQLTGL